MAGNVNVLLAKPLSLAALTAHTLLLCSMCIQMIYSYLALHLPSHPMTLKLVSNTACELD